MGFDIEVAVDSDVVEFVQLETRLFNEDAGVHEPQVDGSWPERQGSEDFFRLLADPGSVVLVARVGAELVGMLAGYTSAGSPTRPRSRSACLRSLYVDPSHRRAGVAAALVDRFVAWASAQNCTDVFVDSYAANEAARGLYERMGFEPLSVRRARILN